MSQKKIQPDQLRSRQWFNNPEDLEMTALYLERYLNYGPPGAWTKNRTLLILWSKEYSRFLNFNLSWSSFPLNSKTFIALLRLRKLQCNPGTYLTS